MMYTEAEQRLSTMMRVRLDGSVPPAELMREAGQPLAVGWSPDRRYVLFLKDVPGSGTDLLMFPADDPKKITPLLTGPANEGAGTAFSPDGRWLAFNSDRSGRDEIYVVRFRGDQSPPALGGQPLQISADGGGVLAGGWRRDGKEIVFRSLDAQIMAVPIEVRGEALSAGRPVTLFRLPFNQSGAAMTPNADRFLVSEYPHAPGQTIHVLTNWHQRLNQGK